MKSLRIITVITVVLVLGSHIIQAQPNPGRSHKSDEGLNESKKETQFPGLTDKDPIDLSKDDFAAPKSFEQHNAQTIVKSEEPKFPGLTYRDPVDMAKDDFSEPKSFEPNSALTTDLPDLDDSHQRSDGFSWLKNFFMTHKSFEQHSVQTTSLPDIDEDKVKSKEQKLPGVTGTDPIDLSKDETAYERFLATTEASSSWSASAIESFKSTYLTTFTKYIKVAVALVIIVYSIISNFIPLFFHVISYIFGKYDSNAAGMGTEEIKRSALADATDYVRSAIRKYKDMQNEVSDYEEY